MPPTEAPTTRRVTLTKAQLSSEAGQRLVALCIELGLDGEFSDDDLRVLHAMLSGLSGQDIPAVGHLKSLLEDAFMDGMISDSERTMIQKQIERVLPAAERARLAMARSSYQEKQREKAEAEARAEEAENDRVSEERREQRRKERESCADFNVPTEAQLRFIHELGGTLPAGASKRDASILIDQILHSSSSITPRQRMVLRFWGKTPPADVGKPEVSQWMSDWYEEDEDRRLAWELFKESIGDTGNLRDPEQVPFGIGPAWLAKVKANDGEFVAHQTIFARAPKPAPEPKLSGATMALLIGGVIMIFVAIMAGLLRS